MSDGRARTVSPIQLDATDPRRVVGRDPGGGVCAVVVDGIEIRGWLRRLSQAKPSQAKPSQAKPSQAKPSQAKPSQASANRSTTGTKSRSGLPARSSRIRQDKNRFTHLHGCAPPGEATGSTHRQRTPGAGACRSHGALPGADRKSDDRAHRGGSDRTHKALTQRMFSTLNPL